MKPERSCHLAGIAILALLVVFALVVVAAGAWDAMTAPLILWPQ
jgi:hypothetical protein